ncbi:molybdopterin cofactor-binding domain-containing protein [Loktanella sp. DJP18]|uniref:molybdopterin cofactor-binding domain-containing protein n=1 Tax=Loktanella sp. DJP18 TaxID=3409788 RepID=UPI003BB7BEB3
MTVPGPLLDFPNVDQWLTFGDDGGVHLLSGRVELGQGISTALAQIAADELDVAIASIRLTQGHTALSPAEGPTVGSLSVTLGGQSVRIAAAAARSLMLHHAAGLLQSTVDRLTVRDGHVLNDGVETGLHYGNLAAAVDLAVPAVDHGTPKQPADRYLAGTSVPRIDLAARLGAGHLLHDMTLDGLLHGRVVQPPRLDATAGPLSDTDLPEGVQLVRDGQFIAVVAACEYAAQQAAQHLAARIVWDHAPEIRLHPVDALTAGIASEEVPHERGDLTAGDRVVQVTLTKPALHHASIGPSCAVARWDDGRLTVWAHSQNVFALRTSLAQVMKVPVARITVIFAPGAGCYGHNSSDDVALDAALMARATGRPVRVLWHRRDEFQHGPLNPAMTTRLTARLGADGLIVSYDARIVSPPHSTRPGGAAEPNLRAQQFLSVPRPMGPGNDAPQPQGGADRNAVPGYVIPALRVVRARPTHVPYRPSAMRGLGAFTNVIALESLMEGCAAVAGMDSVAYRLAHLDDPRAREVITALQDMTRDRTPSDTVGYGLGYARYKNSAGYMACLARVDVGDDVRVTDVWSVAEAINPDGVVNQIEGGIVQAISWALKEEVVFAGGQNMTFGWQDYPILRFSEVPRLHTRLIERPDMPPLGAGEIAAGPAGAAVVNGVQSVLGVRPDRLPLTRHALVTLLGRD